MGDKFLREKGFLKYTVDLALPLMLQSLLYVSVTAINSIMFGQFGEVEMSGYSQAAQAFYIYSIMSFGFTGACKILVAQYWGRGNTDTIRTVIAFTMRIGCIFAAVFGLVFLIIPGVPMRIFSSDPAVVALGCEYLRVIAVTTVLYSVSNTIYNSFGAIERTSVYLWGNLTCYGINLIANYLLIFGKLGLPRLGVLGAGIGCLIGRVAEFALLTTLFLRSKEFNFKLTDLKRKAHGLLKNDYFRVFKPIMGHEVIYSIGISMGQIIMGQISTLAVSAYNICYVFSSIMLAAITGLSGASQTITGKIMGSGDLDRAKRAARTLLVYALVLGSCLAALILALGNVFISFYHISPETEAYAKALMPIMAAFVFFSAFEYVALVSIPRSGGDGRTGFLTDCVVMWCIAIPLAWLAALKWNLSPVAVIALLKIDMPLKAAVGVICVLRMRWVKDLTRDDTDADVQDKQEKISQK